MAEVTLKIGERSHVVACREGGEAALIALGHRLDRHAPAAARAAGSPSGERMLLFVALLLADEMAEAERAPKAAATAAALAPIAERLEAIATALEEGLADA